MRVFVTPHALQRIEERGGDAEIIAAARRAARRISLPPRSRAALDIPYAPEVIPVVEARRRRGGDALVVITVLSHVPDNLNVVFV